MIKSNISNSVAEDFSVKIGKKRFSTILADPPWQFDNRTGKMAPEHKRLSRYTTLSFKEIMEIPVASVADNPAHLYLWVPNALLPQGGMFFGLGDSNTSQTSFGTKFGKTADRMDAVSVFIFVTQPSCFYSEFAAL
jgi:hypothetical protein